MGKLTGKSLNDTMLETPKNIMSLIVICSKILIIMFLARIEVILLRFKKDIEMP